MQSFQPDPNYLLLAVDFDNLYPSVDHGHFRTLLKKVLVTKVLGATQKCHFLWCLCCILLSNYVAFYDGRYWQAVRGFLTGPSCGVHGANLYLSELDELVTGRLKADLKCFLRFVDDAIMYVRADKAPKVLHFLHSWHPSIR